MKENEKKSSENPIQKFNAAFALMVVIPFLGFMVLATDSFNLSKAVEGIPGAVMLILLSIGFLGYAIGYSIIRRLFEKIVRNNQSLQNLDQLKSLFVSEVSHEVRSPMVSMQLALLQLNEEIKPNLSHDQEQLIKICERSMERLIRLSTDILDLTKLESGKMETKHEIINLGEVWAEVRTLSLPRAKSQNVQLMDSSFKDPFVFGDNDHLTRIFINLVDNAIKYTPEGKKTGVDSWSEHDRIFVDFWNEGEEISANEKEKLFERFKRLSRDHHTPGTGLGLSIVKDLLELQSGSITVYSKNGINHFLVQFPSAAKSTQSSS